jgi:D-alanine transaminase
MITTESMVYFMILFNGELLGKDEVRISYEDRGYYFGDGVYEVFRIYRGRIYEKQAHLARLARSAGEIELELPYSLSEIDGMIERLLQSEQVREGTLYLQITRGTAPRSHLFPENVTANLLAYCTPVTRPVASMTGGITAVTVPDIRWLRCDIKTLNLLPNTLAKQQAVKKGAGEAILLRDGIVTECSAANIMIVKNGTIYTHPANHLILHGVTRAVVLRLAKELNMEAKEEPFSAARLMEADEAFITGTTVEITPIVQIDGKPVGGGKPGPVTRLLQEHFAAAIERL